MTGPRVVVAGYYPPPFAGEPIHVKQLAGFLRTRGLEAQVLNLNRHAPPSTEYLWGSTPWKLMGMLFALSDRQTILHLHTNGHNWKSWVMILTAALAARLKKTRALLTIHSGLFPGYTKTFGPVSRRLAKWTLGCFCRVIAVNSEIGRAMRDLGVSEAELAVIPAFLGVPNAGTVDGADRTLVEGSRPLMVVVGGGDKDPEMGLPVVIGALPALIERFPGLRAVFIGWQVGPKTRPLIEAQKLGQHATCVGEIPHERCLGLLQEADVVVRSTFADGDAITVREALDLGVPVVASDTDFRPAGVVLFRKGDARDLLDKLTGVLESPRDRLDRPADTSQPGRELWGIYREVGSIA
jgi:glycosyltransferase involved in cell wall biosynthesis